VFAKNGSRRATVEMGVASSWPCPDGPPTEAQPKLLTRAKRVADLVTVYGKQPVYVSSVYTVGPTTASNLAKMQGSEKESLNALFEAKTQVRDHTPMLGRAAGEAEAGSIRGRRGRSYRGSNRGFEVGAVGRDSSTSAIYASSPKSDVSRPASSSAGLTRTGVKMLMTGSLCRWPIA